MNKGWFYVFVGGFLEVFWVLFLKLSMNLTVPLYTVLTIISVVISFYIFSKGMALLPSGIAYTVYSGIGAIGTLLVGSFLLKEPLSIKQIFFSVLLLIGIFGLKFSKEG